MYKQKTYDKIIELKDSLHSLIKQTLSNERGMEQSNSKSYSETDGYSKTKVGTTTWSFLFYSHSSSNSTAKSKSTTTGETKTQSEHETKSISIEQQNSMALELEKFTDQYIKRIIQGFNTGYWETSITFGANDETTCKILGGTFIGELSKPDEKLLPPPRLYIATLGKKQDLLIPKNHIANSLFPKLLTSYITSEELSQIASPPVESVPGYEIHKMPYLSLTDLDNSGGMKLGNIVDQENLIPNNFLFLSTNDLNKHIFVCGLTGSGKTTTVKHILKNLTTKENIPFLVFESAKHDYRQLMHDEAFKDKLNIFTIGDATVSHIRFNPFYIQKGTDPLMHIDYLKSIFNASFSLYGPMPAIIEKCLHNIYLKKGWDLTTGIHPNFINENGEYDENEYNSPEHYYCFPTLSDLKDEVNHFIQSELEYKGEYRDNIRTAIIVRLESLCVGSKGLMFNTNDFFPIKDLLSTSTILEMENLSDDDDKAFFLGLILVLIREYRQRHNPAINPGITKKGLQHFLVIEEAHRLLKNVITERTSELMGNPKGKAVEDFCNVIAEMRSLGQGVAVVEQIPSKISPDVIKNSNTKIVHRLVSKDDQTLLSGSLGLEDSEALYLNRLKTGHALCYKEGMGRPVECAILDDVKSLAVSDEKINRDMKKKLIHTNLHKYETYQLHSILASEGEKLVIKLLNSLVIAQSKDLEKLKNRAIEEANKILLLKNNNNQYTESVFTDYFVLKIMLLLNTGIYCRHTRIPNKFRYKLFNTINNPSAENREELLNSLKIIWKTLRARDFVIDTVENLTINNFLNNNWDVNNKAVEEMVKDFFLLSDKNITSEISNKILRKIKKEVCNDCATDGGHS